MARRFIVCCSIIDLLAHPQSLCVGNVCLFRILIMRLSLCLYYLFLIANIETIVQKFKKRGRLFSPTYKCITFTPKRNECYVGQELRIPLSSVARCC